jgi:hypothetical protein
VEALVCDQFHQRKVGYMEFVKLNLQSALELALALELYLFQKLKGC